jgi:L-ectoine synthase
MIIRKIKDIKNTDREVVFDCGMISNRIILKKDNIGFSLTKTVIPKGDWRFWHYKNHLEACYCVSGSGKIKNLETNEIYKIDKETTYILDKNEPHEFKAITDTVLLCVFNPPLVGQEKHGNDGSYKLL